MVKCNNCYKYIYGTNSIQCNLCTSIYHKRCVDTNRDDIKNWYCFKCSCNIFPFNHIADDNEFLFTIQSLNNCHTYNKFLELKFDPLLFEIGMNNNTHDYLQSDVLNSCNYIFDPNSDFKLSIKSGFSILHLNARSVNKNQDLINAFISNLNVTFSVISLSETWFKEDHSNLINITNYNLLNFPRQGRRSGGSALYIHESLSYIDRSVISILSS